MRDPRVEQYLAEQAVEWVYEEIVPLKNFDRERSLKNKGRMIPLTEDTVERYAMDMRRGNQFPAVVAFWDEQQRLVLLTGNHRLDAARRVGRSHLDAYCVEITDPAVVERITRTINNIEGVGVDAAERLLHAVELVRNHGYTVKAAAVECRIGEKMLGERLRSDEVVKRLTRAGLTDKARRIVPTTLARMIDVQSDLVLGSVANLAADAKLSRQQVQEIVGDVVAAGSEANALLLLDDLRTSPAMRAQIQVTAGGRHPKPKAGQSPYQKLVRSIGTLRGVLSAARSLEDLGLGDTETRETVLAAWNDLVTVMEGKLDGRTLHGRTVERHANGAAGRPDSAGAGRQSEVAGVARG